MPHWRANDGIAAGVNDIIFYQDIAGTCVKARTERK